MEEESSQFRQERQERIRLLHERQAKEVDQFDEESTRLGFRYVTQRKVWLATVLLCAAL